MVIVDVATNERGEDARSHDAAEPYGVDWRDGTENRTLMMHNVSTLELVCGR